MTIKPYKASWDCDLKPYVDGPGNGCGYYHGTLWPDSRLSSEKDAQAAADIANIAYWQGYWQAQQDIRKALGL